jgi:hypothetical protein
MEGSHTRDIDFSFAVIKHSLMLYRDFHAVGQLDLRRARIAQDLKMDGATISNKSGFAILGDSLSIGGNVFLRADIYRTKGPVSLFRSEGVITLIGATINTDLDLSGANLSAPKGNALDLERSTVGGELFLSTRAGAAEPYTKTYFNFDADGVVDLRDCRCRVFEDDPNHWPKKGHLRLNGFTYDSVARNGWDAVNRKVWLELDISPATQPYRQVAKVLRESGQEDAAKQILVAMEEKIASEDSLPIQLANASIGYGYHPGNAVWGLAVLSALGWVIYRRNHRLGKIIPTDKDAAQALQSKAPLPDHYPRFQPLIFSLENTFPLVKLGQADKWQPAQTPATRGIRWVVWAQIILGWLLATLFVAGIGGLVQHN